jgi:hypothetical protein
MLAIAASIVMIYLIAFMFLNISIIIR